MTIYEKLAHVQQELKAPKNQRNNFGNYNYRSCEDILEAVKPLLAKYNLTLTISDEMVEVGGRVYVKATSTLYSTEEAVSGAYPQTISVSAYAREDESQKGLSASQLTGSTSSYSRKYCMNGLFCIDDTKDADALNTHGHEVAKKTSFVCEECGKPISDWKKKDGTVMTADNFAGNSLSKYGRVLCYDCIKKK